MMETFIEEETINYAKVSGTVSKLLEAMASQFHAQLNANPQLGYVVTVYDSYTVPDIQLSDYLFRVTSLSRCTPRDLIVALVYIDKLINLGAIGGISFHNMHRLMAIAIMTSTKFFDDVPFSNKSWSKIVGISLRELNYAESVFLQSLNFEVNVPIDMLYGWSDAVARFAEENPVQERQSTHEQIDVDQNSSESNISNMEFSDSPSIPL